MNLQRTKHHKKTDLVIHSKIDAVMEKLCERLGVVIPVYTNPKPALYSSHTDIKICSPMNISLHHEWTASYKSEDTKESPNNNEMPGPKLDDIKPCDLKRTNGSHLDSDGPIKKEAKQEVDEGPI